MMRFYQPNPMGAYFDYQVATRPVGALSDTTLIGGTAILWFVTRAVGGYVAGKAIAPDRASRGTYAWVGALAGSLGGPVALGILGAVALSNKR